jgi:hypothetical protein
MYLVSEIDANNFLKNSFFNNYKSRSSESFNFFAAAEAHGKWDGRQPYFMPFLVR